ncbi:2-hydroxychromene-2-carboxylate isomerase [Szabonella alba]|uniref:2-hydroxychromene-2-carboxylate isomerase n=1 Tax=Szabonella alba TaxID=2804194 RepID=A0A8K0Y149_9RHOB|nr:2-hydroxychromene-2-carboxylate isomerase [Szabonella alba]MBL4918930.1 2-hydroxychromene-2-carboxylate isomerase [Szabonella alba]
MARIDYYFTVLSPYVYLAGTRPAEIAARNGAELRYFPLDANALFARTGGLALKDRHESRRAYRLQELRRQSKKAGLVLNPAPARWPTNPAPASYALIGAQAAKDKGATGDLATLLHGFGRAAWAEDRDIAEDSVIRDCLTAAGFDPGIVDSSLLLGAETYAANLEEATARGVFGAPFFVVGEEMFWGQDRLDDLDLHLSGAL